MAHLQLTTRVLILLFVGGVLIARPILLFAADSVPVGGGNSINGLVWIDLNGNGHYEEVEPLAVGQMVFVTPDIESDFAQILVLASNARGEFSATNLVSGRYRVWAATQNEEQAAIVNITDDRAVMAVQLPLVGFTLYMPQVTR